MQAHNRGEAVPDAPATKQQKSMDRRLVKRPTNKYLNIIKGDITELLSLLSNINGTINPYCWYRRWRNRKMEYKDFMEQHFGRSGE